MHRMGSYFDSACGGLPKKGILLSNNGKSYSSGDSSGPKRNGKSKRLPQRTLHFESDDMTQIHALNKRLASLTIADMSPKLAHQRILLLYEKGEHREAASFIRRLSQPTFRSLTSDLPLDYFMESMPQSLPILEAVYSKIHVGGNSNIKDGKFSPETVVWQIVKFFAAQDETRGEFCGPWVSTCKRLLSVLLSAQPRIKRVVAERKKALTRAIEGLGQHGMVGTSDESLMNLHDALKVQFEKVQKTYGDALDKLGSLSLVPKSHKGSSGHTTGYHGNPPVAQSHQRQLSLKAHEIQERLIKNKTLLNVVEPALENHSLEVLLGILQRRIELDKEVLFQFTQLKKELTKLLGGRSSNSTQLGVAPLLMKFQRGCQQVLDLMKEVSEDEEDEGSNSDFSGYHSDSDSAIMMSGNSPFVSKSARCNFLSKSGRYINRTDPSGKDPTVAQGSSSSAASSSSSTSSSSSNHQSCQVSSSSGISSGSSSSHHDSDSSASNDERQRQISSKIVVPPTIVSIVCNGDQRNRKFKKDVVKSPTSISEVTISKRSSSNPGYCQKCESRYDDDDYEIENLRKEATLLRLELEKTRKSMSAIQERDRKSGSRSSSEGRDTETPISTYLPLNPSPPLSCSPSSSSSSSSSSASTTSSRFYDSSNGDHRPVSLVRKYAELFSSLRAQTLNSLNVMKELNDSEELKNKLLFSVVVLSFRSATSNLDRIRDQIRKILQLPTPNASMTNQVVLEMEYAVQTYLRKSHVTFDLSKSLEDVSAQIWATLYDYPCLKGSKGLKNYIDSCVRVSWGLVNQIPKYDIDYEDRTFHDDIHVRYHSSSEDDDTIKTYLWPALREGRNGPCVFKAVVVT